MQQYLASFYKYVAEKGSLHLRLYYLVLIYLAQEAYVEDV